MLLSAINGWNVLVAFEILISLVVLTCKLRKRFPSRVNCWFCNTNSKVAYNLRNSWICPQCDQYNGFSPDGGYNQDIPAQYCAKLNGKPKREQRTGNSIISPQSVYGAATNGLCRSCNRNQELKVQQLASFIPKNSRRFDEEVAVYKKHLEEAYALCNDCESVVRRQLNRVKKTILGLKVNHLSRVNDHQSSEPMIQLPMDLMHKIAIYCVIILAVLNFLKTFHVSQIHQVELSSYFSDFLADYVIVALNYCTAITGISLTVANYCLNSLPVEVFMMICTAIITPVYAVLNPSLSLEADQSLQNIFTENFTIQLLGLLISLCVVLSTDGTYQNRAIGMFMAWSLTLCDSFMEDKTISTDVFFLLLSVATTALSCYNLSDVSASSRDITDLNKTFHRIYSDYSDSEDNEDDLDVSTTVPQRKKILLSPGPKSQTFNDLSNDSFRTVNSSFSKNYADLDGRSSRNSLYATAIRSPYKFGDCTLKPDNSVNNLSLLNESFQSFDNRSVFSDLNSTFCDFKTVQQLPNEAINSGIEKLRITDSGEGRRHMGTSPYVNVWKKTNSIRIQRPNIILANAKLSPNTGAVQSSWVAGGFWNGATQKKPLIRSRFLASNQVDDFHPIESRSSSLSSGFESRASSVHDIAGQNNSRESSVSGDVEVRSAFSEPLPQRDVNLNRSPPMSLFTTKNFHINRPLPVFPTITSTTQAFIYPTMFNKH
ncbi:hypothetical protein DMENIID0001_152840 [Sergentomyia squamirostris]